MDGSFLGDKRFFGEKLGRSNQLLERVAFEEELEKFYGNEFVSAEEDYLYGKIFQNELSSRRRIIKGKIINLGLAEYVSEIIGGMNQTSKRARVTDFIPYDNIQLIWDNSDAALRFGLDYIDRWVMYNDLFN